MLNPDELKQARQKYYTTLNRLNLLLLKQHGFRHEKQEYQNQLNNIQNLIRKIKHSQIDQIDAECSHSQPNKQCLKQQQGRNSLPMHIITQDNYLRSLIKSNAQQIKTLERKLQGKQILNQVKAQNEQMQRYRTMISTEFQNGIQQKLSMIRGKVDDLKKKIKELNKQILSHQQDHLQQMDDYSLKFKSLDEYRKKNQNLSEQIRQLKEKRNNK